MLRRRYRELAGPAGPAGGPDLVVIHFLPSARFSTV
jgi:hypothetical protein